MHINDLRPGLVARIAGFALTETDERRLREHGLDVGVEVELLHRAAFGADPVAVRVGSAAVAMRRAIAAGVLVSLDEISAEAAE